MNFTFSDMIAGYVQDYDPHRRSFGLQTTDGRPFRVRLTASTYAEVMRNLDEPYLAPDASLEEILVPGRYLYAHGVFYPEDEPAKFEAKHLVLPGQAAGEYRFEEPDWWIKQMTSLAEFYLKSEFPDGVVDYSTYRTHLTVEGNKVDSTRQETDTISRIVYGFATAYLLTGNDRYLDAAESGTEYLRAHMRGTDDDNDIVYWYHGVDVKDGRERKVLASQFGDDYDAIPAYEQIYALAGPTQTYRITGDPRILQDAERTINLFDKYFLDRELGGYFSHVDPIDFDPRADALTIDRARKNWNSVGDHAPAYLINLYLATGEAKYADMLASVADTITERFPDYDRSPFVQERFHEDWTPDTTWGWQQNRAVVGHNLKIAWNLMRVNHLRPNGKYVDLAQKIAEVMPAVGQDLQRGGWYDVVERVRGDGEQFHRLVWHDRKAWWQQEQAMLAYLIMTGSLGNDEYLRQAREACSFYNAWFPDHDSGGVYFNVLADGMPYLLGTERLKGSHSMSGYHSFELCYLASVYTNLLIRKESMDLYFKPQPGVLPDNVLRVAPDLLPTGSVRLQAVWINDERWTDFDADAMTVTLPDGDENPDRVQIDSSRPPWSGHARTPATAGKDELRVRVRLAPAGLTYGVRVNIGDETAEVMLDGEIGDRTTEALSESLARALDAQPQRLVLRMEDVGTISKEAARSLVFACQNLTVDTEIFLVGSTPDVAQTLSDVGFLEQATEVGDIAELAPAAVVPAADKPGDSADSAMPAGEE